MKRLSIFSFFILIAAAFGCNKSGTSDSASAVSGAGGSTARFTISGNYLYSVDHQKLKAFDITNANAPVLRSEQTIGVNIETIFPFEDKLFIGSSNTMYIFSLSNPGQPTEVSRAVYQIRMACDPVIAKTGVAYATLKATGRCGGGQSALVTYNITNINQPVLANTDNSMIEPNGLGMKDNALYVCDGQGLKVMNIQQPYLPQYVRTISGETFYDVIPYGNTLIAQVAGGVALYDISNALQPTFLSKIAN